MASGEAGTFGALLRRYRQAAALSQEALAERARISAVAISALERGVRRAPYLGTVDVLATAMALGTADRAALLAAARPSAGEAAAPFSSDVLVSMVGRDRELALLSRILVGGREPLGSEPVLLLAGEPGIGKTRLLQAAAQQAIARGWSVLVGGCQRRGGQEPFAPLLDALIQYLQATGPAQMRGALSGCAWLVRVLPELAANLEPLPDGILAPEQERRLIHAAVGRLLRNLAGPAGTLLVLDDLQWAGPDALDLIHTLARAPTTPVRIVGAYRDTEVRPADPLGILLADLAQARLVRQHRLGPLAPEEAAALLANLLVDAPGGGGEHIQRVVQSAGGTPFFLVSYAQALHEGSTEGVPWDAAQAVQQRVALLAAAGQEILGAAAIVGRRVPCTLLVAVAGQPEGTVLAGLEAACRARLLLEDGDDAYVFAHDVIREVVEAGLGAARRAVLHRRVAEALEGAAGGAPPELLAYHFARGGSTDRAVPYLEQAGDRAMGQRACGAAERHYREALERLEHLGRAGDVQRVREKLGEVFYQTGRYVAAAQVLESVAVALRAAGNWEGLGDVVARVGWLHSLAGTPHQGMALIQPLLRQLEHGGAAVPPAALYAALGQLAFAAGEYAMSTAANQHAAALARASGDRLSEVRAEYNRLCVCGLLGQLGAALAMGQDVIVLAETTGHLNTLCAVLRDLAIIHALRGAPASSRDYIERATAVARQMQDPGPVAFTQALRGWILSLCGEWTDARAELDAAVALSRQTQRTWYSPYPLMFRARLSLTEGERSDATGAVREALELAEWSGDLEALRWVAGVIAELDILEGRAEAARARLLPLLDRPDLQECNVTMLLPVLAWAELELGRLELADAAVEQALRRARPEEMRIVLVEALRVRAMIALRRGRWDDAARDLEEGLALARSISYPYAEARLLHIAAQLHAQRGEPEAAREWLAAAGAIFARLGAQGDAAPVAQASALCQKSSTAAAWLSEGQWK